MNRHPPPPSPCVAASEASFVHGLLLILGTCLPVMGSALIAPVLPKMQAHFADVPDAQMLVAISLTVPALVIGVLAPFAGAIADRVGRMRPLLGGMLLYAVFGAAPLWLDSLPAIIASRIGVGFAEAAIMTCCTVLIGDYFEGSRRAKVLAQQTIWPNLAAVIFVLLGGALGDMGWRTPFWLYFASWLLLLPMGMMLWEPKPGTGKPAADLPLPVFAPFPWVTLSAICILTLAGAIAFYLIPVHLGFLLDALGEKSTQRISLAIGIFSTAIVVGTFGFIALAPRSVSIRLALGFGLLGAGFLILARVTDYRSVAVAVSVSGVGAGLLLPTLLTWAMSQLTFDQRGRGMGAWTGSFFLGQFICPLLILAIASHTGSLTDAINVSGLAASGIALGAMAIGALREF